MNIEKATGTTAPETQAATTRSSTRRSRTAIISALITAGATILVAWISVPRDEVPMLEDLKFEEVEGPLPSVRISGQVRTGGGSYAMVFLVPTNNKTVMSTNGDFEFDAPPGKYSILVTTGKRHWRELITLSPGA